VASALHTVEATGFGRFMRESLYAYPVVEAIHIAGLALLFGSIALVDLRLLGLGRRMPIALLAHYAVPWTLLGFLIAALSGLAMFTAHAAEFIVQPVFMLKMALILAGGINAAVLHMGPLRDLAHVAEHVRDHLLRLVAHGRPRRTGARGLRGSGRRRLPAWPVRPRRIHRAPAWRQTGRDPWR